jgi:sulfur carrier protein ThiS
MRITVRSNGRVGGFLPGGGNGEVATLDLAEGASLRDLMDRLPLPESRNFLVTLNAKSVPKARRPDTPLRDGDEVAVMLVPLIG